MKIKFSMNSNNSFIVLHVVTLEVLQHFEKFTGTLHKKLC